MADVIIQREGLAGRISLNRPDALHALTLDMCLRIGDALEEWRSDPAVEFVLLDHAPGTRGFCAGGDIRMLAESGAADGREAMAFFAAEYRLNARIHAYPKPYITFIDGVCMGGGVGLSVHGSHRLATERTLFAMPETGIGLFPDVGGGWFLPRLGPPLGMWLALTGERLKGADVAAAGVATHYAESQVLADLRSDICRNGPDLLEAMTWDETGSFERHLEVIDRCFGRPSVEEIFAALAGEEGDWARTQLETLRRRSPQTLKVAHRQLTLGLAARSFEENMAMEYRIASRVVRRHDFLEGVRAVIIDRDNAPVWNPPSLEDIGDDLLDEIFSSLGPEELTF